ncbi:MAG TPA: ferritin-like protein [Solirubrobacterales bacterium]|nr:ferritin-like protein [Solirubrobacterales bacterium]
MRPSEWDVARLREHLKGAVELELLTIPPYLTALYSLHPGSNETAALVIRSVVVEEMLHLTLAANVLNAVGGAPEITNLKRVPRYPSQLPFHKPPTFEVGLLPFGDTALDTFLAIENPTHPNVAPPPPGEEATVPRVTELAEEEGYETIGAFYKAIEEALRALDRKGGLFSGPRSRQITPEYYYASGGEVIVVEDLASAMTALEVVVEQGEGEVDKPGPEEKFDPEHDLAHFYRFKELRMGRRYEQDDQPDVPTGPAIDIDLEAVYPMKPNLKTADLGGELKGAAEAFNRTWSTLLREVQDGIDGRPAALGPAVARMFRLRDAAELLLAVPLPDGSGENAGPTFEYRA